MTVLDPLEEIILIAWRDRQRSPVFAECERNKVTALECYLYGNGYLEGKLIHEEGEAEWLFYGRISMKGLAYLKARGL